MSSRGWVFRRSKTIPVECDGEVVHFRRVPGDEQLDWATRYQHYDAELRESGHISAESYWELLRDLAKFISVGDPQPTAEDMNAVIGADEAYIVWTRLWNQCRMGDADRKKLVRQSLSRQTETAPTTVEPVQTSPASRDGAAMTSSEMAPSQSARPISIDEGTTPRLTVPRTS